MDYHCFEGGGRREVKERGSIFSRFAANVETVQETYFAGERAVTEYVRKIKTPIQFGLVLSMI